MRVYYVSRAAPARGLCHLNFQMWCQQVPADGCYRPTRILQINRDPDAPLRLFTAFITVGRTFLNITMKLWRHLGAVLRKVANWKFFKYCITYFPSVSGPARERWARTPAQSMSQMQKLELGAARSRETKRTGLLLHKLMSGGLG